MGLFSVLRGKRGGLVHRSEFNQLLDALERMLDIKSSQGLSASVSTRGLAINLMGDQERWVWAKVTAAPPYGVPVLPSQCLYSALPLGREVQLQDALPKYGRDVFGDEVHLYPAKVGDMCGIVRNPRGNGLYDAELFILTEYVVRGDC